MKHSSACPWNTRNTLSGSYGEFGERLDVDQKRVEVVVEASEAG